MLSTSMIKLINDHKLGFVASIDSDGSPNLSPKGTFVVLDSEYLMFSEIRSPNTLRNIQQNPEVEINFVDPFSRKGVRVKGITRVIEKTDEEFNQLFHYFEQWGELSRLIRHIVIIKITRSRTLCSPIYDLGAVEGDLINSWSDKYKQMYELP